jgi:hypothetical protein
MGHGFDGSGTDFIAPTYGEGKPMAFRVLGMICF